MRPSSLNILLTGGSGYIGSHTAVVLQQTGHRVFIYDNSCNSDPEVCIRLQTITGQPFTIIKGDIRDTALLKQTMDAHAIDAVIHFAGLKAVGESAKIPVDYYANNVQGTISLLQAMQAASHQPKTLVFSSSATVYGDPQYLPIDESHPTAATNPYGRTKLHIEEILTDLSKSDPSWRIACLRYFNPVGAHPSGLIGENPNGLPNNLMPFVAQVAVGKLKALNVFGNDYDTPDGTGVRDYIHVMDLAEGHLAALNYLNASVRAENDSGLEDKHEHEIRHEHENRHERENKHGHENQLEYANAGLHTFNLGTGRGYSVLEMIQAFESASGQSVPFHIVPRRVGDIASCYASTVFAAEQLGWRATRDLKEMCESSWRFQTTGV